MAVRRQLLWLPALALAFAPPLAPYPQRARATVGSAGPAPVWRAGPRPVQRQGAPTSAAWAHAGLLTAAFAATGVAGYAATAKSGRRDVRRTAAPQLVIGEQASSKGPAAFLRRVKEDLPQFSWLAEGEGNPANKVLEGEQG